MRLTWRSLILCFHERLPNGNSTGAWSLAFASGQTLSLVANLDESNLGGVFSSQRDALAGRNLTCR